MSLLNPAAPCPRYDIWLTVARRLPGDRYEVENALVIYRSYCTLNAFFLPTFFNIPYIFETLSICRNIS